MAPKMATRGAPAGRKASADERIHPRRSVRTAHAEGVMPVMTGAAARTLPRFVPRLSIGAWGGGGKR